MPKRFAVVTVEPPSETVRQMVTVAERRGHQVTVLPVDGVHREPGSFDVVLNRLLGDEHSLVFGQYLCSSLREHMPVINGHRNVWFSYSKLWRAYMFAREGIPHVPTFAVSGDVNPERLAFAQKFPFVMKADRGICGETVWKVENFAQLNVVLQQARTYGGIAVQPYVVEASTTYRAVVVGGRIVGAVARVADEGWKANLQGGGAHAEPAKLSKQEQKMVLASAKAAHLEICGADFVRTEDEGTLMLELNPAPGLLGTSEALGKDLCEDVVTYMETFR